MTNFEKIKEFLTYEKFTNGWSICGVIQEYRDVECANVSCTKCQKWLQKEYQEPILDRVERKYLSGIIKPFRKDIAYIIKFLSEGDKGNEEYIAIVTKTGESIDFPYFPEGTMYKRMKADKKYKLQDLEL